MGKGCLGWYFILFMSFRERFQGKISVVGKRGLKHTLFQPKQGYVALSTHREVLSSNCQSTQTISMPSRLRPQGTVSYPWDANPLFRSCSLGNRRTCSPLMPAVANPVPSTPVNRLATLPLSWTTCLKNIKISCNWSIAGPVTAPEIRPSFFFLMLSSLLLKIGPMIKQLKAMKRIDHQGIQRGWRQRVRILGSMVRSAGSYCRLLRRVVSLGFFRRMYSTNWLLFLAQA